MEPSSSFSYCSCSSMMAKFGFRQNDLKEPNMNISEKQIEKLTSKEWKNIILNRIISLKQRNMKESKKTKLRLLKDNCFGKKDYIAHKDAANLLLLKLNMSRRCGAQEEKH